MANWPSSVDSGLGSSVDHCVLFVASPIHLATSWEFLDVLAVAAVAYRKADPAPRSTSTTDRALPSSAVQFRRGRRSRGSERMRTTSAVSIATSVPAPIAIPRSDCASAGASFTPYRVRERSARACARGDRAVANHAEHIYARINASTRAAPGVFSMQRGLLPEEDSPRASSPNSDSRTANRPLVGCWSPRSASPTSRSWQRFRRCQANGRMGRFAEHESIVAAVARSSSRARPGQQGLAHRGPGAGKA